MIHSLFRFDTAAKIAIAFMGVIATGQFLSLARADESCPIRFENTRQCARIEWKNECLSAKEDNPFRLVVWSMLEGSPNGPFEDLKGTLLVEPEMDKPGMHHGTAPVTIERAETGIYEVTDVDLYMSGKWDIILKQENSGRILDRAVVYVDVPGSECHCGCGGK